MKRVACRTGLIASALLSTAALAVTASGAAPEEQIGQQIARGGALYSQACATCHGAQLEGGTGPALASVAALNHPEGAKASAADLAKWIRLNMPVADPGSLSTAQADDLSAFLLARSRVSWGAEPLSATNSATILLRKATR
ncbi:MAG: cytochrome c class [Alphaproteobacteria bacterium]|nr:cytochrome c class [Alphaproteobacteria bacterium]